MDVISACAPQVNPVAGLSHGSPEPVPVVPPPLPPADAPPPAPPLHRLAEVRQQERLSRRTLARRLGISVGQVKQREQPSSDLSLSELRRWQAALGVPIAELLHEPAGELTPPVQLRAHLLRAMKTVRSIEEGAQQVSIRRLATMLANQLVEVMPELSEIASWPARNGRHSHAADPADWHFVYERRWR